MSTTIAQRQPAEIWIDRPWGRRVLRWEPVASAWRRAGRSPYDALVLLHGIGHSGDVWRPMLAAEPSLPAAYPVLALDLPGHGEAGPLSRHLQGIGDIAERLSGALAELGVRNPVLAGHSLGGRIALEMAIRQRPAPAPVILIDVCPTAGAETQAAVMKHLVMLSNGAAALGDLIELVNQWLPLADRAALDLAVAAMATTSAGRAFVRIDPAVNRLMHPLVYGQAWPLLASSAGPIGLIRGEFSSFVSKTEAERMMQSLARPLCLETVAGAGHAIPLEQPRSLALALARALAAIDLAPDALRSRRVV